MYKKEEVESGIAVLNGGNQCKLLQASILEGIRELTNLKCIKIEQISAFFKY